MGLKTELASERIQLKITPELRSGMEQRARELHLPGPEVYRLALSLFIRHGASYTPRWPVTIPKSKT